MSGFGPINHNAAMVEVSKASLAQDLKSAASVPLVGMCILLLTANLRGFRGHDSLQVTSEVTSDLLFELSHLNYQCSHPSLAVSPFPR